MAPRYMSDRVKLLLTLTVLLVFVILTASTEQCTSKKTERGGYVIRNVGIKLCHLKCAEHGQCASIEYDIGTLTCRLSIDESKIKRKDGHVTLARSYSHAPTGSCTSDTCSFGQRCLKTRSGKDVCVQASTTDVSDDLTSSKTVPPAPVTTQDCDPHVTPSQAKGRDLYDASRYGDLEKVKQILAAGHVDINTTEEVYGWTPVMVAARWGHRDVVEFLVGRGADVSLVDSNGDNVLHLACWGGDLETIELILSLNKVNVNTRNKYGRTVADYARGHGHQQVLNLLEFRDAH